MLHPEDSSQDFVHEGFSEWIGDDNTGGYGDYEFYKKDQVKKDGFIHENGSLKFLFWVDKKNYRKKKRTLKAENKRLA